MKEGLISSGNCIITYGRVTGQAIIHNFGQNHCSFKRVGGIAQWLAYLFPEPSAPGWIPNKNFNAYERLCLEESGKRLEHADLELASGKLLLH